MLFQIRVVRTQVTKRARAVLYLHNGAAVTLIGLRKAVTGLICYVLISH